MQSTKLQSPAFLRTTQTSPAQEIGPGFSFFILGCGRMVFRALLKYGAECF